MSEQEFFQGIPVVRDPDCPADTIFLMNDEDVPIDDQPARQYSTKELDALATMADEAWHDQDDDVWPDDEEDDDFSYSEATGDYGQYD